MRLKPCCRDCGSGHVLSSRCRGSGDEVTSGVGGGRSGVGWAGTRSLVIISMSNKNKNKNNTPGLETWMCLEPCCRDCGGRVLSSCCRCGDVVTWCGVVGGQ